MKKNYDRLGLAFVILLSLGLRLFKLDYQSYWIDEMFSLHVAKSPVPGSVFWDNSPFLYHLFLKMWVGIFGDSEFFTRLPSVIFSVLTTVLIYQFAKRIYGFRAALISGVVHALSSYSIMFAQETRMYALFEFLVVLNLMGFTMWFYSKKGKNLFILSFLFLFFTHYLALVIFFFQALWYFIDISKIKKYQKAGFLVSGTLIAWLVLYYSKSLNWDALHWQKAKYAVDLTAQLPLQILLLLTNNSLAVTGSFLFLVGLYFLNLSFKKIKLDDHIRLFFFFSFLPLIVFLIISTALQRAVFVPRYFIYVAPYFSLLIAALVENVLKVKRQKIIVFVSMAVFLTGTLMALPNNYLPQKAPWRELAQAVAEYPSSIVFTTRTETIKTPYFENRGIEVKHWEFKPGSDKILFEALKSYDNVWIVENFWGGRNLIISLKSIFHAHPDLLISEIKMDTGYSEPLYAMRVYRKK